MTSTSADERHILLIDDDAVFGIAVAQVLGGHGFAVHVAANGREALDLLRRGPPVRLILLDLMMPGMSGWQFRQEQIRDPALASIPVVILSAADQLPEKAEALWAADWFHKPIDLEELLAVVQRLS